jgi:peptidoglycan hydrolase CwlO-like protein
VNSTALIAVFSALLGGGGIAAVIQIFLLPRTMAKARADTTSVLVGTARETVELVHAELGRSQQDVKDLRDQLSIARGRMLEQEDRISEQQNRIRNQEQEIDSLNAKVRALETRVQIVSEAIDHQDGGNIQ